MLLDPVMPFYTELSNMPAPASTSHPTVPPIPSVIPDLPIYERIGHSGMVTLWVVFIIMLLSTLAFISMAWRVPVEKRIFHVITAIMATIATVSYLALATGDGSSFKHVVLTHDHKHTDPTHQHVFRQVFWARYVDWALTTPLLLLNLAFVAGMNGADITVTIVANVIMVLTGLFAAFGHTASQRWGYYIVAWLAFLAIIYQVIVAGRRNVAAKGTATTKFYGAIGSYALLLWTVYPVIWGVSSGSRSISVNSEVITYAVLDVLAVPVFGFWLLATHARSTAAGSVSGFWSRGLNNEGALRLDDDEGA